MKYVALGGSSYIPLPKYQTAKKAIINLKKEDDECFKWPITRALNPVEKKTQKSSIGWDGYFQSN